MSAVGVALSVLPGIALLGLAVWVWRWDPRPGSGLAMFPAAYLPGYSKVLSVLLGLAGLGWLVYVTAWIAG